MVNATVLAAHNKLVTVADIYAPCAVNCTGSINNSKILPEMEKEPAKYTLEE